MSETNVGADANAPVLSGTFSGEVHMQIATGPDADALAQQLLRDYGPPMANLKATMGTQQRLVELETRLNERFARDDQERITRQLETDSYRHMMERRLSHIETSVGKSLWASAAALVAASAAWVRGETRGE